MGYLVNPQETIAILNKYKFIFQKRFGQNFLIDEHVLNKIINAANISKDDVVLEIGPGIGTMTQFLCENAGQVIAVEIDRNLIPILESDTLSKYDNVTIINEDILKLDLNALVEERCPGKKLKVVANLPYYITTPIIMGLFEKHVPIENITVMVQAEVAARMQAGPGTKDYGALSLAVQFYAEPYIVANVPQNCFMPRPNVASAVIRLTLHNERPVEVEDEEFMFKLIHASFNHRRKTLVNGLMGEMGSVLNKQSIYDTLAALDLKETARGEEFNLELWARFSDELKKRL
ncbi:MAG: 16S rRNA (adenine(1518)-N(6)/adenine(1519)-N(6))-dimethyltransferase RsmA [Lachnospiraceae bacterium]|nr:16S rRNA (adenine(1518)-N(6)/adenine(1519)-N(6))-dimethyltransferase RsmA [Lachnospiraceae bacterium]